MTETLVTMRPRLLVRDLVACLKSNTHGAYPITAAPADPGQEVELLGVILRTQLLKMLEFRVGYYKPAAAALPGGEPVPAAAGASEGYRLPATLAERKALDAKLSEIPNKALSADKIGQMRLTDSELSMMIDLTPFMQRHPHVIHADCNLARAYRFFRIMGLRHMFVTPARPHIVGMITRKVKTDRPFFLGGGKQAPPSVIALRLSAYPFLPPPPFPSQGHHGGECPADHRREGDVQHGDHQLRCCLRHAVRALRRGGKGRRGAHDMMTSEGQRGGIRVSEFVFEVSRARPLSGKPRIL